MSKTTVAVTTAFQWIAYLTLLAIPAPGHATPLRQPASLCAGATPLPINSTERIDGSEDEIGRTFQMDVGSAGLLTLDVAVPGLSPAEPILGPVFSCGGKDLAAPVSVIERAASGRVLEVTPGTYAFRVGARDPRLRLAEYKLRLAFVEGPPAVKSGDPNEDEPDPEPLVADCGEKSGDPNEDEPDPEPLTGPMLDELCLQGEVDDHGDTAACATPLALSRSVQGEIGNDWGDDEDYFLFVLSALRTVEIETLGAIDTAGELYDRYGHRLAIDDDGGGGDNFRIVTTLAPGPYTVRVAGRHGAEGSYRLAVRTLRRP